MVADFQPQKDEDKESGNNFKTMKAAMHPTSPSFIKLDDTSSNSNFDFNDVMHQKPKGERRSKRNSAKNELYQNQSNEDHSEMPVFSLQSVKQWLKDIMIKLYKLISPSRKI